MLIGDHSGHRQRLLKKMEQGSLSIHEYLETFLFPLIPRVNTNPIAHRLLARFGSLHGVFNATLEQLEQIEGIGHTTALYIYCAGQLYALTDTIGDSFFPQEYESNAFLAFVKQEYEWISCEVLDVFFLGKNKKILGRSRYSLNDPSKVQVCINDLEMHIVKENPEAIVLVHNHPSGVPEPSETDNQATAKCQSLCAKHGVVFCDHIIYASNGAFSYKESGVLVQELQGAE